MTVMGRRGLCFVLAAPSGAGKSTIARALLAGDDRLALSVSVTTRAPRPNEVEGIDYFFRSDATFASMAAAGELLEWARVFGRGYGTPRAPVLAALAAGRDVLFDIDWQGFRQLRAALPGDVVGLFVLPPSLPELEARLAMRAADDADEIARRMRAARAEIAHAGEFDHVIVNRALPDAIFAARAVLTAARCAIGRLTGLGAFVDVMTG